MNFVEEKWRVEMEINPLYAIPVLAILFVTAMWIMSWNTRR